MKKFVITCDSSTDGGYQNLNKMGINFISYPINSSNQCIYDENDVRQTKLFYESMIKGENFKTSQINVYQYKYFFKNNATKEMPLIHISLCEALSNSINNAREAKRLLLNEGYEIEIIDCRIGCLGEYMLVKEAYRLQNEGYSFESAIEQLNEYAKHINTMYTTNTLTYFARGGRLSKASATIGNMFHVNVVLGCNAFGKLKVLYKVIGQKKAFKTIIEGIKEKVINPENQTLYCSHALNEQGINEFIDLIKQEIPFKDYEIHMMGPTIGTHAGPGTLALFFYGKEKTDY